MTLPETSIFDKRPERVDRARGLLREAAEWLSAQVNDEQMAGGPPDGIMAAEQSCRTAIAQLAGLDTAKDVRR